MSDRNGEAEPKRSLVQCRIDKASELWEKGDRNRAFTEVLNLVALLANAISQHSRSYMSLAMELEKLQKGNKDEQGEDIHPG